MVARAAGSWCTRAWEVPESEKAPFTGRGMGGESWEKRASLESIPMYFGQIIADPKDPLKLYAGDVNFFEYRKRRKRCAHWVIAINT